MKENIDLSGVFAGLNLAQNQVEDAIALEADALGHDMADYARTADGPTVTRRRKIGKVWQDVSIQATKGGWAPDTGNLQQAISHKVERERGRITLWLQAMKDYAYHLEMRAGFSVISHAVDHFKGQIVSRLSARINAMLRPPQS